MFQLFELKIRDYILKLVKGKNGMPMRIGYLHVIFSLELNSLSSWIFNFKTSFDLFDTCCSVCSSVELITSYVFSWNGNMKIYENIIREFFFFTKITCVQVIQRDMGMRSNLDLPASVKRLNSSTTDCVYLKYRIFFFLQQVVTFWMSI